MKKSRWKKWWRYARLHPEWPILDMNGESQFNEPWFWPCVCLRLLEKDPLTIPIGIRLGFFKATGRYQL